MGKLDKH